MTMQPEREQALADRMSAALTEIGEASIALVLFEREACAKIVDDEIAKLSEKMKDPKITIGQLSIVSAKAQALGLAAIAIRNRPK